MIDAQELEDMKARADRAHQHVCEIASGDSRWKMSIPANEETDSDLLLAASVTDVPLLVAEVEGLRSEVARAWDQVRQRVGQVEQLRERRDKVLARLADEAKRPFVTETDVLCAEIRAIYAEPEESPR